MDIPLLDILIVIIGGIFLKTLLSFQIWLNNYGCLIFAIVFQCLGLYKIIRSRVLALCKIYNLNNYLNYLIINNLCYIVKKKYAILKSRMNGNYGTVFSKR